MCVWECRQNTADKRWQKITDTFTNINHRGIPGAGKGRGRGEEGGSTYVATWRGGEWQAKWVKSAVGGLKVLKNCHPIPLDAPWVWPWIGQLTTLPCPKPPRGHKNIRLTLNTPWSNSHCAPSLSIAPTPSSEATQGDWLRTSLACSASLLTTQHSTETSQSIKVPPVNNEQ